MGLDTVKLRSPYIEEGLATFLENQCILKSGVDLSTGEVLYEITTGELEGSWDSRISFQVKRDEWRTVHGRLDLYPCQPYVLIECSWHKFFHGQNVYGIVDNFRGTALVFLELLGDLLGWDWTTMPHADKWEVRRVDWAEVYRLSPLAINEFFRGISQAKFPRRNQSAAKYGTNAVYFPGKFTTLKLYHKGPEFKKHDKARVKRTLTAYAIRQRGDQQMGNELDKWVFRKVAAMQRLADNRVRVEVEIHADKLQNDFKGKFPTVEEMTDEYLRQVHDKEVFKLLREGKSEMETVRTSDQVKARLNRVCGKRKANALYAFWLQLAARGEDVIRDEYSRTAFYRNRKELVEAGVSWLASDVFIVANETALPRDFIPMRDNVRWCASRVAANSVFNVCPVQYQADKKAA